METIYLDDFLTDGLIKETEFRLKIDQIDWSIYKSKRVMIKGCTSVPVPTWSYLIIATHQSLTSDNKSLSSSTRIEFPLCKYFKTSIEDFHRVHFFH